MGPGAGDARLHWATGSRAPGRGCRSRCSASTASPTPASSSRSVENDRRARQLAQERANRLKTEALARRQARKVSLEEVFSRAQEGDIKELNIVLKADVAGSLEALQDEIAKVPQEQVAINIIHSQTGGINESDVMLASASDAIIIGFNVRPLADARRAAEREGVDVRTYSVIYKITEDLRNAMEGMLEAVEVEETLGEAEIKQTFKASKVGRIAGCVVTDGKVTRDASVRLIREGTVIWDGKLGSLRRFKDNVQEVEEGQECGIVLDGYADVKEEDVLEFYRTKQVEQTLDYRMATPRMRRINEVLREVIGATIATELSDPRIGFVTVTSVETSPDLRAAKVHVSVLGDEEQREATLEGLRSSHGVIQSRIAAETRMKRTPTLSFHYDPTVESGMRISQLLEDEAEAE